MKKSLLFLVPGLMALALAGCGGNQGGGEGGGSDALIEEGNYVFNIDSYFMGYNAVPETEAYNAAAVKVVAEEGKDNEYSFELLSREGKYIATSASSTSISFSAAKTLFKVAKVEDAYTFYNEESQRYLAIDTNTHNFKAYKDEGENARLKLVPAVIPTELAISATGTYYVNEQIDKSTITVTGKVNGQTVTISDSICYFNTLKFSKEGETLLSVNVNGAKANTTITIVAQRKAVGITIGDLEKTEFLDTDTTWGSVKVYEVMNSGEPTEISASDKNLTVTFSPEKPAAGVTSVTINATYKTPEHAPIVDETVVDAATFATALEKHEKLLSYNGENYVEINAYNPEVTEYYYNHSIFTASKNQAVTVTAGAKNVDVLTKESLALGSGYGTVNGVDVVSGIKYYGNAMGGKDNGKDVVQLKQPSDGAGLYTRLSNREIKSITLDVENIVSRKVNLYVQEESFNSVVVSGLTPFATIDKDGVTKVDVDDGSRNLLLVAPDGVVYLNSITVEWNTTVLSDACTSIVLNETEKTISVGSAGAYQLVTTVDGIGNPGAINWSSDDESVATVSNGLVTGVAAGTATITARSQIANTVYAECEITVSSGKVEAIYKSCQFLAANSNTSLKSYDAEGGYTDNGFTIDTYGAANNGNEWNYVRICKKGVTGGNATFTTHAPIDKAITKATMDFSKVTNGRVNYAKLLISDTTDFSSATEISFTPVKGNVEIVVEEPVENAYYQFLINYTNTTSSNGGVEITGLAFYALM